MPRVIRTLTTALCALLLGPAAEAVQIKLDYTYDSTGFFQSNAEAKLALEKAANDLGGLIASSFNPVTQLSFKATEGGQSATFGWSLSLAHPHSSSPVSLAPGAALAENVFTIFVGARSLSGSSLSNSAPVTAENTVLVNPGTGTAPGVVQQAAAASNAMLSRGGDLVMGSAVGKVGGTGYSLRYGPLGGSLWFDDDFNNDRVIDSPQALRERWQYDPTAPVAPGKFDFYSVALQGMLRLVGLGTSESWIIHADGSTWQGDHVAALFGTGEGLLVNGQVDGALRTPVLGSNGTMQSAVISPGLGAGERRMLTALDAALLQDLGYATVPEPGTALLLVLGALAGGVHRRCSRC